MSLSKLLLCCCIGISLAMPVVAQQALTIDEIVFLIELGTAEDEIISQIRSSQSKFQLSAQDAKELKAKGVSARVLRAMGYIPKIELTANGIINAIEAGVSVEKILQAIHNSENIPAYKLEDWLKLKRAGIPLKIIKKLKAKAGKSKKITVADIVEWHKQGIASDELIRRIDQRGLVKPVLNTDDLLNLKRSGLATPVIKYLLKKGKPVSKPIAKPAPVTTSWQQFNHLGRAFSISYAGNWYVKSKLDDSGYPQYLFSDDRENEWEDVLQGFIVGAYPISDETVVTDIHLMDLLLQYLREEQPGLKVSEKIRTELSGKPAIGIVCQGKIVKTRRQVTGVVLSAVHQEAIFFINYWAPQDQWQKYQPVYKKMLASFVAPAKVELIRPKTATRTNVRERIRDVTDKLRPSVVVVYLPNIDKLGETRGILGFGSGFVIREDGYVITNRHVVDPAMAGINKPIVPSVLLSWDKTLKQDPLTAKVVAVSEKYDLALLKIDKPGKYPHILLSNIEDARSGDEIIVLGFPNPSRLGTYDMNVNRGTLTALEHDAKGRVSRIRHSARTTGGNSGGPLYNLDTGGVVGVHTWGLYEASRANRGSMEKLYWAGVPVNQIYREFPQITTYPLMLNIPLEERINLGAWYFGQKRFGAAMLEFRGILGEDPHNAEALAYIGRIYQEQKKPQEAMKHYRRALKYDPQNYTVLLWMTRSCFDRQEYAEAIMYARRALQQKENSVPCKILIGASLMAQNKINEAFPILKQVEEVGDANWELHYLLGILYMRRGMEKQKIYQAGNRWYIEEGTKNKIVYHFKRSVEIRPQQNGNTYQQLAQVALFENDLNTALQYLDKGIETDSQNTELYLFACRLFFNNNKLDQALKYIKIALSIEKTPQVFYWLGAVLFKVQKFPESLKAFRSSLELAPRYNLAHEALYFMGLIYASQNNYNESVNCFRRALKLQPDFAMARQALQQMGYTDK